MSKCAGLLFALLLLTGTAYADQTITTSTAGGNPETTIIDANGNLKVVESQKPSSTSTATNQAATSVNPNPHELEQTNAQISDAKNATMPPSAVEQSAPQTPTPSTTSN